MKECPYKNFRGKVSKFIDVLRQPREEYGGLPPCPFVGPEVDKDKLMIELFDPSTNTILEMIETFVESKYDSALFVQVTKQKIPAEETFEYQSFINRIIKKAGYDNLKCICFNPSDSVAINGFSPRQHSPYFLINIANRNVLSKAHKKLLNTKYFDNMEKEYLDYLHVKEHQINRNK
jgi:hypothetical protein